MCAALGWTSGCIDRGAPVAAAPPPPTVVTVSKPLQQEITDTLDFTGTTAPLEAVEVRARVTGFLEKVHVSPNARVSAGDLLFTIDARTFQNAVDAAQAELDARKAQLERARFEAERIAGLKARESAGEQEYVDAIANRDLLVAQVAAAQARLEQDRLNLGWCQVTAPINGRISRNLVDAGNIVSADVTQLATLIDDTSVYVYFAASEQDVLILREDMRRRNNGKMPDPKQSPNAKVFMALLMDQGFPYEGVIDYAAPTLDPETGTIQMRAVFSNADRILLPGLFVRLRIPVSLPYVAMMVTERALGTDQGQRYLLTLNDQNVVEYRPVRIGALREGLRVITEGVSADDRIIVNGLQRVRAGVTVAPQEAPMPAWSATDAGAAASSADAAKAPSASAPDAEGR